MMPPLTVAELNAMPRTTSTREAEAVYAARASSRGPKLVRGIPVPEARYRRADSELLRRLSKEAAEAHIAAALPADWAAQAGAMIDQHLREVFPPDEMVVLRRHGMAQRATSAAIWLEGFHDTVPCPAPLDLPAPLVKPAGAVWLTEHPATGRELPVPTPVRALLEPRIAAKAQRVDAFERAWSWAAGRRRGEGLPTWGEIEAAFPLLSAWLQARREGR